MSITRYEIVIDENLINVVWNTIHLLIIDAYSNVHEIVWFSIWKYFSSDREIEPKGCSEIGRLSN